MMDLHAVLRESETHRIAVGKTADDDFRMALQERNKFGVWEQVETLSERRETIEAVAELHCPGHVREFYR